MQQLLARPDGRLVCLEFPTGRKLEEGGPPYSAAFWFYQLHLTNPGREQVIRYETDGGIGSTKVHSINMDAVNRCSDGLAMMARFRPEEIREVGRDGDGKFGRDWVSVWGPSLGRPDRDQKKSREEQMD